MKLIFIFFILSFMALVSCDSSKSENIEYNSEPFPEEQINVDFQTYLIDSGISEDSKIYSGMKIGFSEKERQINRLREMFESINQTKKRDTLEVMERLWQSTFINKVPNDSSLIADWLNITSGLMTITGKPVYADELERVMLLYKDYLERKSLNEIEPYIITRNVDHVYINLFYPTAVSYDHSLGGKVKIELVDSEIGQTANLKINMEKKRYFELFIRIPSSVSNASVEVKKVYYLATTGEYCRIAKKWNDGDVVNITFN